MNDYIIDSFELIVSMNIKYERTENYYQVHLFIPILDDFITSLADRFSAHQRMAYNFSALIPALVEQKSFNDLKDCITFYEAYLSSPNTIKEEFQLYKCKWIN
jgi:hypothetical protein